MGRRGNRRGRRTLGAAALMLTAAVGLPSSAQAPSPDHWGVFLRLAQDGLYCEPNEPGRMTCEAYFLSASEQTVSIVQAVIDYPAQGNRRTDAAGVTIRTDLWWRFGRLMSNRQRSEFRLDGPNRFRRTMDVPAGWRFYQTVTLQADALLITGYSIRGSERQRATDRTLPRADARQLAMVMDVLRRAPPGDGQFHADRQQTPDEFSAEEQAVFGRPAGAEP